MRFDFRNSAASRPLTECAQCGEPLFLAEWSEYLDKSCIRHLWRCETCSYTFETTAVYPSEVTAAA
jgi:ribosomal protein S27AE